MRIRSLFKNKLVLVLLFLLTWLGVSLFSLKVNDRGEYNYQSQIFADKSGYYIYLPATFIYGFHNDKYPSDIETKFGNGFTLDSATNKVKTKYTCGVAILTSPFFLATHYYLKITGDKADGFSRPYFKMTNFASIFYLLSGLVFLFFFLQNYFPKKVVFISLLLLVTTTNLFYYSFVDTYMSHVYSFSMLSMYIWAMHKCASDFKLKYFLLLSIAAAFEVLIRPINVFFLIIVFFINIDSFDALKSRFLMFLKPLNLFVLVGLFILVLMPQLFYFKFISGNFVYYSYTNEGFTNWNKPYILEVLFSTQNGLLRYTPFYLAVFLSSLFMILKRRNFAVISAFTFVLMLYICSSWWCWNWGAGFSQRPFVDILPILVFPLTYMIYELFKSKNKSLLVVSSVVIIYVSYFNVVFSSRYDHFFFGGVWDTFEYNNILNKSKVFPFNTNVYKDFCYYSAAKHSKCAINNLKLISLSYHN